MRLFLALRLPAEVVTSLDQALNGPREEHRDLRWIPPERWHLTLAFFGEVPDVSLAALRARIAKRTATCTAMRLRLFSAGRFGDRVLWMGVDGDTDRLTTLADRVAMDSRPYRPHLTVARARQRADLRAVVACLRNYVGPEWQAAELELIASHLGPQPTYETIETWVLAPPSSAR